MAKLMLFVVASAVALIATAAAFQQKQLRCSDTNSYGSGLTNFKLMCMDNIPSIDTSVPETQMWKDRKDDPARMLDFIEHCTCTLLSMSMVWETMLTHEIEILFAVSRDFVDEFGNQVETALVKQETKIARGKEVTHPLMTVRRNNRMFAGDDGDSLYHYYVLNYIVSTFQKPSEKAEFFEKIIKRAASIYFDLKHLESSYKTTESFPMDHPFTLLMSGACKDLFKSFGPYLQAISMMREGFKNEMWIYRVVSHDETLFKLIISSMLCRVINFQVDAREQAMKAASG